MLNILLFVCLFVSLASRTPNGTEERQKYQAVDYAGGSFAFYLSFQFLNSFSIMQERYKKYYVGLKVSVLWGNDCMYIEREHYFYVKLFALHTFRA